MDMMRFSLIIPTYRRKELLRGCLTSCREQVYPALEIIVVDDASPDDTSTMVRTEFPEVISLRLERNSGPATARNRGITAASGDIIVFTDDDCLLPPDFLMRLAEGYRNHPEIAGAGGYLEAPDELLAHNRYAQYDYYMTHTVYGFGPLPVVGGLECPAGGTHSMSYRARALAEVDGFDESFASPGGEDADLKARMVAHGYTLLYVPVKVIHRRRYTLPDFWNQYFAHGRGSPQYRRKHAGGTAAARHSFGVRVILRGAGLLPDLFRIGPRLVLLKIIAGVAGFAGKMYELRRRRAAVIDTPRVSW
jgi:GT2 family glycosyltransferase